MKRVVDIILSLFGIVVILPVLLLTGVFIRLTIGKPVVFKQKRPGLDGKIFTLYKFRTMKNSEDPSGKLLPDASRLTKFGVFLRKTSLDELPELFNVLIGDMSLVGPRPLLPEYLPLYTDEQRRRHEVKPGITGWAQVNGRNELSWEEKFELDVWYVDNQSFWLDLKILLKTLIKVIKREGISPSEQLTMEPFRGTN